MEVLFTDVLQCDTHFHDHCHVIMLIWNQFTAHKVIPGRAGNMYTHGVHHNNLQQNTITTTALSVTFPLL